MTPHVSLICVFLLILSVSSSQADDMSRLVLSTHVLDTSTGKPAVGVFVELYKDKEPNWVQWHNTATNTDGRIQFPFSKDSMAEGTYKLKFNVGEYYERNGKESLYPYVEIVFKVKDGEHYHIPLLLTPFGYSTYRGS
ncbi:5-hydroxyisourate hydrolase isoform X1 [Plutella xylostella]|uniref:5-hydroxyisourate hydrolase isoform X1 n=2 Tax=Plutella xylostella TaxID=51655 RepID=UPI00203250D7|nr:5-hydroxyisourate hydrolase isoform X1 [Plutella xylostella]